MTNFTAGWWRYPDGLAWQWAGAISRRARRQRYEQFMRLAAPDASTRLLDVGVTADPGPAANWLERQYPWADQLTACGLEGRPDICDQRGIPFVAADGCDLPFADDAFDLLHCNAVIEHVGPRSRQRRFVAECCRVARRVWLSTPDAAGPLEPHTLVPLAHWLPQPWRAGVYRLAGRDYFATSDHLNPLDGAALRGLFPRELLGCVRLQRQRLFGLAMIVSAWLDRS